MNPSVELIAMVSLNTTTAVVNASYGVTDVHPTAAGVVTVTLDQDLSADSDVLFANAESDANILEAVGGGAANEVQLTMTTAAAGAAADGGMKLLIFRVLPGLGECTYSP